MDVSTEGKKADLIQRILEAEAAGGVAGDGGAPEEEHMEEEEELEDHTAPPVAGETAEQQAPASKHAKIVFGAGAEAGKKVIELQKPSVSIRTIVAALNSSIMQQSHDFVAHALLLHFARPSS